MSKMDKTALRRCQKFSSSMYLVEVSVVFLFCCALLVVVQDIALAPGVPLPSSSIDVNHGNDESFPGVEKSDSDPLIQNNLPRRAARSWLPPQTLVCEEQGAALDLAEAGLPPDDAQALQFFSIGDQGTGGHAQRQVASTMHRVLPRYKGKFVLGLGDNFYMNGVNSVRDPQWKAKFEVPYGCSLSLTGMPFYPTIGDHDHCQNPKPLVEYTSHSRHWRLPDFYHEMQLPLPSGGDVQVIVTDSVGLEGAFSENITDRRFGPHLTLEYTGYEAGMRQLRWLEDTLSQPKRATWRIVVGHRPVLSGSQRFEADARAYPAERRFRDAMTNLLAKHQVDVYLDGHDHTTQWLCVKGVSYIVNGVGGYDLHALQKSVPPETIYQNNTFHGFALHQLSADVMKMSFVDEYARLQHVVNIPKFGGCTHQLIEAIASREQSNN